MFWEVPDLLMFPISSSRSVEKLWYALVVDDVDSRTTKGSSIALEVSFVFADDFEVGSELDL